LQTGAARAARSTSPVDEAEMKLVQRLRCDNFFKGEYRNTKLMEDRSSQTSRSSSRAAGAVFSYTEILPTSAFSLCSFNPHFAGFNVCISAHPHFTHGQIL